MTLNTLRHTGYLLCLLGIWFRIASYDYSGSFRFTISLFAFWFGVLMLAASLFFDWIDQNDKSDKK